MLSVACPLCRQVTPVPAKGTADLQSAFHIIPLIELRKSFKNIGSASTSDSIDGRLEDQFQKVPIASPAIQCSSHPKEDLRLYCYDCEDFICFQCAILGGTHHSHRYEKLDDAFEKYKIDIMASLEPMEKQLATIEMAIEQVGSCRKEVSDQQAAIQLDIDTRIAQLKEILDARRDELTDRLNRITQVKTKELDAQQDQLEVMQVQLRSCLEFMEESLKIKGKENREIGKKRDMLMMKNNTLEQVQSLTTTFQPDVLMPSTEADVRFSASSDATFHCKSYGALKVPKVDPSQCYVTKGDNKLTVFLNMVSFFGEPHEEAVKTIHCELISEMNGARIRGDVTRKGLSRYSITYQPSIKGRHRLYIWVNGEAIKGSPYRIMAEPPPVKRLGTLIRTITGVQEPWGVAIDRQGCLVVTEFGNSCVSVFDAYGERVRSFGRQGLCDGDFYRLSGVAVDEKGAIYVIDSNNRIQKFDQDGNFLGKTILDYDKIRGIAFNAFNKRLYATCDNCVQALNSDLSLFITFGKLSFPHGIACDSTGKIYVADYGNSRIMVFKPNGRIYSVFAKQGHDALSYPVGIAIDSNQQVYVTERSSKSVSVFGKDGLFLTSFGGNIGISPHGLVVDNSGIVYVFDYSNNAIHLF